jgi:hypothetical protein
MMALDQDEFLIDVVNQKSQKCPAEGTKRTTINRHRLPCDVGAVLRFAPASEKGYAMFASIGAAMLLLTIVRPIQVLHLFRAITHLTSECVSFSCDSNHSSRIIRNSPIRRSRQLSLDPSTTHTPLQRPFRAFDSIDLTTLFRVSREAKCDHHDARGSASSSVATVIGG